MIRCNAAIDVDRCVGYNFSDDYSGYCVLHHELGDSNIANYWCSVPQYAYASCLLGIYTAFSYQICVHVPKSDVLSFQVHFKNLPKGLIPRPLFLGEMRKISREMNERMRIKGKLLFARKNFASPVSRSQFYSLRKRKE